MTETERQRALALCAQILQTATKLQANLQAAKEAIGEAEEVEARRSAQHGNPITSSNLRIESFAFHSAMTPR